MPGEPTGGGSAYEFSNRAMHMGALGAFVLLVLLVVWAVRRDYPPAAPVPADAPPATAAHDPQAAGPLLPALPVEETPRAETVPEPDAAAPWTKPPVETAELKTLATYEAEDAALAGGVKVADDPAASRGALAAMEEGGTIAWKIEDVPEAGTYILSFGYRLPFEKKHQTLVLNGKDRGEVVFDGPANVWQVKPVPAQLKAGANIVTIKKSWGWMEFDYVKLQR